MSQFTEITMSVGSALSVCDTIGGSYALVAGVKSYKHSAKRGSADASTLADSVMVKKPKRIDPGEITLTAIYGKTEYAVLWALYTRSAATAQVYWKLTDADGSVAGPFFGHISAMDKNTPDDDPVTNDITIDVSGTGGGTVPSFTPG